MANYKIVDRLTGIHTFCRHGVMLDNEVRFLMVNGVKPSDIVITVEEVEEEVVKDRLLRIYCHCDDQLKFGADDGRSTITHSECVGGPAGLVPGTGEVCPKCQGKQYFYIGPELEQAGKQKVEAL